MFRVAHAASLSLVLGALVAVPAQAQQPTTLTANGLGEAKVQPENRKSDASIREAVKAANAKALPDAMANARAHAAELATAAGVTLGPLVSIADGNDNGYLFYGARGTFGNGHYCGKVRNTRTVVRNGVRRRVTTKGSHRVCRVPPEVYATVSLTFSVS